MRERLGYADALERHPAAPGLAAPHGLVDVDGHACLIVDLQPGGFGWSILRLTGPATKMTLAVRGS